MNQPNPPRQDDSAVEQNQTARRFGRRELLRVLAASSGAVAASSMLPGKWVKPVVEAGVLPAHAQVTPTDLCPVPDTPDQQEPPDDRTYQQGPVDINFIWDQVDLPEGCERLSYGWQLQQQANRAGGDRAWTTSCKKTDLKNPTFQSTVAGAGASFRWRVWATTEGGSSPSSGWWYFQIAGEPQCSLPDAPQLVSPVNATLSGVQDTVTLDWNPVDMPEGCTTLGYNYELQKDNDGAWNDVSAGDVGSDTEKALSGGNLGLGDFRWRASAYTEAGASVSGWAYFSIQAICGSPGAPQQVLPTDGFTFTSPPQTITLDWNPVSMPDGCTSLVYDYRLEKQVAIQPANGEGVAVSWEQKASGNVGSDTKVDINQQTYGGPGYFRWWVAAETQGTGGGGRAQGGWWYFTVEWGAIDVK